MTLRQQYPNEELVHKLRVMLNDLPNLRTRAMKKLEHWREAAVKRLLARQRELEKTLLDKFERLEFDTQLFVERTERRKAQQQRRWQSEPFDYLNKSEIDRISLSLRSIREELEQSKQILVGDFNLNENHHGQLSSEDPILGKLAGTSRFTDTSSTKTTVHKSYETTTTSSHDLGLELKRVFEICTSPQCSSTTLDADELSPLQPLDHAEYLYDAKSKQTTATTSTTFPNTKQQEKPTTMPSSENNNRRHARLITNVPIEQQTEEDQQETTNLTTPPPPASQSIPTTENFEDPSRRGQRLREVRKNLRTKYDDHSQQVTAPSSPKKSTEDRPQSVHIPVERISHETNERSLSPLDQRDRRYRSRTLEVNQTRSVDNQIYGNSSTKTGKEQQPQHRSESHRHRTHRILHRRSSEDTQEKPNHIRRRYESTMNDTNEIWFEISRDQWANLLESGWRPTADSAGVSLFSFADSDDYGTRVRTKNKDDSIIIDLYEQISRNDYVALFDKLDFAYIRTIDLGNEFWRFLELNEHQHLCLYHQLNKQFIMYKPELSLLSFPWPYDGIVDISWSNATKTWVVATQTQIIICNRSFSKILQSVDIRGDWPKRITSCRSSVFHTYKMAPSSMIPPPYHRSSSFKDRPQFLLERFDYKLNSICKHILESSTIWDIEADDVTDHLAVLCDVALLLFDYQLNLLRQIEVTGFKVTRDHFGGWLVADYNASCIWQIRRNEYLKANKILHVERPWSVILDRKSWTLITLSETQNRAKRLLFFTLKNIPASLDSTNLSLEQSQQSISTSSSISESLL